MHAPNITQSDPTNPYIQIWFNINSKNVVNNNILSDQQKQLNFDLHQQEQSDKGAASGKKVVTDNRSKFNKSMMSRGNATMLNTSRKDNSLQDPITRPKKKGPSKINKNNLTVSETDRSSKNTVHKKNTSQGLGRLNPSEQAQLSEKKLLTKSKSKLKSVTPNSYSANSHRDTRERIIELMIRDYERGSITADNLKEAISSLIDREAQEKRLTIKTQSKSEKARTRIPTSYKNSLAASLHNTPKHKPSKSKSQKFHYHSCQPSMVLKMKQCNHEPQIVQRVIHNKEFMSKIVIKGINSSLFLSNEWTDKDSPVKESQIIREVNVNVINTSDSVRDLKREMNQQFVGSRDRKDIKEETGFCRLSQQRQEETTNILANFIYQLKRCSQNEFLTSGQCLRRQKSVSSSQNSLKYLTRIKESSGYENIENSHQKKAQQHPNSLDEFQVREEVINFSGNECSRIQELQKEYALLLKDKQSESRNGSSLHNHSVEQFKNNIDEKANNHIQLELSSFNNTPKIKSYVSSELQNKLQNSGSLSETRQELNQKRAKSITQFEIKKLSQIMDVIKDQLGKKDSPSTHDTNDSEVLEQIVSLLESERTKAQLELKIYDQFDESKTVYTKKESKSSSVREDQQPLIEQNQIINSFQKKLKRLNILQAETPIQSPVPRIFYQSSGMESACSSHKSLSSHSSAQLQKVRISELNLDEIEMGLRRRLNDLEAQREQEFSKITEKFINDKITPRQYQEEKQIIEKWFEVEASELRRTKKNLLSGYKQAKQFISKNAILLNSHLTKDKSAKMIKCISEKYLNKTGTNVKQDTLAKPNKAGQDQQQRAKRSKKPNIQRKSSKLSNPQKDYETIEKLQEDLLISNIMPRQKNLCVEKQSKQFDALSPMSIQQSDIFQEALLNILNNSNDMPQKLIPYEQCNNSEGSDEFVIRNKRPQSTKFKPVVNQQPEASYQYEQVKSKRPYSAKVHSEIAHYLSKYEEEQLEEDILNGVSDSLMDKDNEQNQSSSNSQAEYLEQYAEDEADNQQSSNEQYDGYNDTEEGSVDVDSKLQKPTKQEPNQQSLSSSQGLILDERPLPSIVVNKPSLPEDELFSPKKPTVHEQFSEELLQYTSTDADREKVSLEFTHLNKQFNEAFLKLKYLTEEDKDDIFEFMFLDLCLELFLEQTKNNRIMKSIEKHLVWQRRKRKIPKGFKTGLDACRLYITNIQEFLLKNYIDTLKRLQSPMGPSAKQMLKFMRDYDDMQSSEEQIQTVNLVLPIEIYEKFESQPINKLQVERYYDEDEKQDSRLKFLKSLKHFHHKAMFDSLNEMLDVERSYGIWGKPFPWKKALDVDRKFDEDEIKKKLKHGSDKLVQNCSYFCGVLVDKEESVFGKSNVSEEYLSHIREDRMSKMLSNDMVDNEDRWIFYDDQQTQVLVSLTKTITADLISEILQEIKVISWK